MQKRTKEKAVVSVSTSSGKTAILSMAGYFLVPVETGHLWEEEEIASTPRPESRTASWDEHLEEGLKIALCDPNDACSAVVSGRLVASYFSSSFTFW
jgi:hypothetical protein